MPPLSVLPEARAVRQWLALAVGVLVLAGAFAVLLVVARMPPFDRLITDPAFFRRALVVHVNFALIVWFYAFVAGLVFLLPGANRSAPWTRRGVQLSAAGVLLLGVAAGLDGAVPVLSNYVPMVDHPLFALGHLTFGAGVLVSLADRRLAEDGAATWFPLEAAAIPGLRAAGVGLVLAAVTFAASWLEQPRGVTPEVFWELYHWGGGHVLQLVSEIAMVSVWLMLLGSALKRPVISRPVASALFALLLGPWLVIAPLLAMSGTQSVVYHAGFTDLMRWGIFPVVSVFLVLCLRALWLARRRGEIGLASLGDPRIAGFVVSAGLTVLGFVLGAMIRGSNTMVPAHYHASIGAVTASFMAVSWMLAEPLGWPVPARLRRLAAWQPLVYGAGQMVFAAGFGFAGAHGMARKTYGAEQAARGLAETVGLGVMGIGGLVAVVGGLLFLRIAIGCAWPRRNEGTAVLTPMGPVPLER
jgi:cytochrome c oxidase subunit 1